MDFGDILDHWELRRPGGNKAAQNEHAGGAAPSEAAPLRKVHPIDHWLRINGVHDKDAEAADTGQSKAEKRRRLRIKKPDAVIDIHGLTRDEAWDALERFFGEARGRALEKLLIIHGKGNHSPGEAVLKRSAREFIERCPFAGESGQEKSAGGGSGATWVLLKAEQVPSARYDL
jgi:DNA-nicking Smr family endonuclease